MATRRNMLLASAASFVLSKIPFARAQAPAARPAIPDTEWRHYGGDAGHQRYAPLDQINAANFNKLEVAWRFKPDTLGARPEYNYQTTPLVIGGKMYTTAGSRRDVVSLDARTGEMLWLHRYDEGERGRLAPRQLSGHGLSYWSDGTDERILYVTPGYVLFALDARTGRPISTFGTNGMVDLRADQGLTGRDLIEADIGLHATPAIAGNTVIVGAAHDSGNVPPRHENTKGMVRGFDVRTGKRMWVFHTIPQKGEFGYDTWTTPGQVEKIGNTGVWAQITVDTELGLAYLPVETPTGDYIGIYRHGPALYGESLVAVDINTGKRRWHYQTIHHGIWDRDLPCAATLCDIPVKGKIVKALAMPTKQAFLFVLNRETGEPIWPIREVKVEKGDVPGEWYSPTQPVPTKPPAYDYQGVTEDKLIDFTPDLRKQALELVKQYKIGPLYTPPIMSKDPSPIATLNLPGTNGGTNWPGGSFDPETYKFYVYSQTGAATHSAIKNPHDGSIKTDFDIVHGIVGSTPRQNPPSGSSAREEAQGGGGAGGARRGQTTVQGLPLIKPPYGRITCLDLSKGDIAWQVAHGETPDNIRNHPLLKGLKIPRTGRAGIIGTLVTKSLVIAGESGTFTLPDGKRGAMLRAYDKGTGEDRGAIYMPAPQTGSPMTYMLGGQQYLVVAIASAGYSAELIAYRVPRA